MNSKTFSGKLSSYYCMPESTESELIERFKTGDLMVFNLLTKMWYDKILGFLYRTLGNIEEAEDVCQKTFITVYSRLNRLNENDKFATWLYRIAHNCALDHIRDRKNWFRGNGRMHLDGSDETSDLAEPEIPDMERQIDGTALHSLFEETLGALPDEQRIVIVMKLYQDLKFTEIAEITSVPVNTVKTRMYSGLRTMKEALNRNRLIEEILRNAM